MNNHKLRLSEQKFLYEKYADEGINKEQAHQRIENLERNINNLRCEF